MKEHDLENRFSRRGKGKNEKKKVKEHNLEERFRKGKKIGKKKLEKKKCNGPYEARTHDLRVISTTLYRLS